mmetsp:Transcript_21874/g.73602  ORF Transcript_21874/g.73602 Transcript_21874/m.73602 type:complete len:354 (+) Transcript_21874:358-1419(+)
MIARHNRAGCPIGTSRRANRWRRPGREHSLGGERVERRRPARRPASPRRARGARAPLALGAFATAVIERPVDRAVLALARVGRAHGALLHLLAVRVLAHGLLHAVRQRLEHRRLAAALVQGARRLRWQHGREVQADERRVVCLHVGLAHRLHHGAREPRDAVARLAARLEQLHDVLLPDEVPHAVAPEQQDGALLRVGQRPDVGLRDDGRRRVAVADAARDAQATGVRPVGAHGLACVVPCPADGGAPGHEPLHLGRVARHPVVGRELLQLARRSLHHQRAVADVRDGHKVVVNEQNGGRGAVPAVRHGADVRIHLEEGLVECALHAPHVRARAHLVVRDDALGHVRRAVLRA